MKLHIVISDHKYDPISQRDYYALQAVFAGVRHGEREVNAIGYCVGGTLLAIAADGSLGWLERRAVSPGLRPRFGTALDLDAAAGATSADAAARIKRAFFIVMLPN